MCFVLIYEGLHLVCVYKLSEGRETGQDEEGNRKREGDGDERDGAVTVLCAQERSSTVSLWLFQHKLTTDHN